MIHPRLVPINEKYEEKVSNSRVTHRVWYFEKAFEIIKPLDDWAKTLQINRGILYTLARSYFYDIERLKDFHGITRVEHSKIAAFTAKWILKHRPIFFSVCDPDEITQSQILYFNERFALQVACSLARIPTANITKEVLEEALYTFHYRNVSEDLLVLWLKALGAPDPSGTG